MELIKIYNGKLVNARELHAFLESRREFATWIKDRIRKYGYKEGTDFFTIDKIVKRENSKRQGASKLKEYHLTIDTAKEIAMIENNEKGREARLYFINAEKTLLELKNNRRLKEFLKLEATKGKLHQHVMKAGGSEGDYIQIDTAGSKVFFNGNLIPDEELPTILLMGRGLATEMTNEILKDSKTKLGDIEKLNKTQHEDVRDLIIQNTGKAPEELPREEKIKKLGE